MRAPIRPLQQRWPAFLENRLRRFFWADPRVIVRDDASAEQFRTAMSALHVGNTIKITGTNRHPKADALLVKHAADANLAVLDIGASDGSTSLDLIDRLPNFAHYTIADRYLHLDVTHVGSYDVFFGPDGDATLIVGRRVLAWPGNSRLVRTIFRRVLSRAASSTNPQHRVLLLNPDVRAVMARDPRVVYRMHDIFEPWPDEPPTVIKVANVLRRLYFSDEQIAAALAVLLTDLPDGGHLLIVDNPRISGIAERCGLYCRDGDRFTLVEQSDDPPEISDLILAARASRD